MISPGLVYDYASRINWSRMNTVFGAVRDHIPLKQYEDALTGRSQYRNTQKSLQAQIDYDTYLRKGNQRALADWHRNLPGREIKYPEFSYVGQIARANTSIYRASGDYTNAYNNYIGNLPYRAGGLYGIGGRLSRSL